MGEVGDWSVGRVLERDTLSNNSVYQDMLREGRRKGLPVADTAGSRRTLQKKLTHEQEAAKSSISEMEERSRGLHQ